MTDSQAERMIEATERIAECFEESLRRTVPQEVDIEAIMTEAMAALRKTNPAFRLAFEAVEKQLAEGGEVRAVADR